MSPAGIVIIIVLRIAIIAHMMYKTKTVSISALSFFKGKSYD